MTPLGSRGFIQLPVMAWAALGAALVIAGLGVAVKVQTARLDACKSEHAAFVATVEANGKAAEERARKVEQDDRKRKEQADAENAKTRRDMAGVYDAYKRLREQRSAGGFLSAPAPGARSPERACFDRAELERAMGEVDAVGAGIAKEGDEARIDLDTARRWAH